MTAGIRLLIVGLWAVWLSTEQVVTPEYEIMQPNGPDCPTVCRGRW